MGQLSSAAPVERSKNAADVHTAERVFPRLWPFLSAATLSVVVIAFGLASYRDAADPMPVHWNIALQANEWAPKNLVGFLAPAFIGLGVTALFWVIAGVLPLATRLGRDKHSTAVQLSPRQGPGLANEAAALRLLEHLAMSTSVLIGTTAVASWVGVPAWLAPWLMPALLLVYFALLLLDCARVVRAGRR